MKRICISFIMLFILCISLWAQENTEEDEETAAPDSEQTLTKRQKIKNLYDEYWEKSDEVSESQRISGFQMVADFITDKLPLTLDLGAEPGEHGSTVFGVLQYDWSKKISSRIRLEYQSVKISTDNANEINAQNNSGNSSQQTQNSDWLSIKKSKQIECDFYPFLRYFGDEDRLAKTPFVYFGIGGFYLYNWYSEMYSGWSESEDLKVLTKIDIDGHYHQFGPIAIGSIKMPFLKVFGLTLETTFSPINRVINAGDTFMQASALNTKEKTVQSKTEESSLDTSQWCSPLLKIDVAVDIFTYFRVRTRFDYKRIYLGELKEVNFFTFNTDEQRRENYVWRYGLEIVFPSSNRTRKKNSHLWAGVYYEHEWDVSANGDDKSTVHNGKWIFCFGT